MQYRIRNDDERHERVTSEDSLESVDISLSGSGATLIERTLDMAKGHKRSNREIRKPKQETASTKPESSFGNQIKVAANANGPGGKGNP